MKLRNIYKTNFSCLSYVIFNISKVKYNIINIIYKYHLLK